MVLGGFRSFHVLVTTAKQTKNSLEKQGNILCFLQRFENDENKNETSSDPGYRNAEFSVGWRQCAPGSFDSRFGCFVLWSSFSSASFSKLPFAPGIILNAFRRQRSYCQFLCHNQKKSPSRDLETVVNLTASFITLSFFLYSKRKTKLLAIEQTFYALHSVYHLTCRK